MENKFPKSKMASAIGAPVRKDKVNLPYFMGSMDKIKPAFVRNILLATTIRV